MADQVTDTTTDSVVDALTRIHLTLELLLAIEIARVECGPKRICERARALHQKVVDRYSADESSAETGEAETGEKET